MSPSPSEAVTGARQTRAAVFGGAFGFFVDMYDVYLPTIALTPAIAYFVPPGLPSGTRAIVSAFVFVSTLLGRPVGSLVFGRLADRMGRRRVTLLAVAGCGATTLVIGVLPGYQFMGAWAVVAMIGLRFVDGVFLGGEYTGGFPLAMEAAPDGKRGRYGGLVGIGFPLAYCSISLLSFLALHLAPAGGLHSPYTQWGWRIPFLVGAALSGVFLLYYSRNVSESAVWLGAAKRSNPIKTVLFGAVRRDFWQVFLLMVGVWFASNMASGLLPATLHAQTTLSPEQVTGALILAQLVHAACFPFIGALTDRIGRRVFFAICGGTVGVLCAGSFAFLATGPRSGFVPLFGITVLIRLSGTSMFAVTPSYICERFPAAVRGSGFGLGYSLPLIVTAGYAYYQDWMTRVIPYAFTSVVLLVLGGAIILIGALLGPETRHVDLHTDASQPSTTRIADGKESA